jgi:hypothetical protein
MADAVPRTRLLVAAAILLGVSCALGALAVAVGASSPGASPAATWGPATPSKSFQPLVVLVQFDHPLSAVDQERFELRYSLGLESADGAGTYRFRIMDGINAAWKADSIRRGTDDGQTWAGTTADKPPSRGLDPLLTVGLLSVLAVAALGAVLFWRRRLRLARAEQTRPRRPIASRGRRSGKP